MSYCSSHANIVVPHFKFLLAPCQWRLVLKGDWGTAPPSSIVSWLSSNSLLLSYILSRVGMSSELLPPQSQGCLCRTQQGGRGMPHMPLSRGGEGQGSCCSGSLSAPGQTRPGGGAAAVTGSEVHCSHPPSCSLPWVRPNLRTELWPAEAQQLRSAPSHVEPGTNEGACCGGTCLCPLTQICAPTAHTCYTSGWGQNQSYCSWLHPWA